MPITKTYSLNKGKLFNLARKKRKVGGDVVVVGAMGVTITPPVATGVGYLGSYFAGSIGYFGLFFG